MIFLKKQINGIYPLELLILLMKSNLIKIRFKNILHTIQFIEGYYFLEIKQDPLDKKSTTLI